MNINKHTTAAKRVAEYAQKQVAPVIIKTKKQFLTLMQKAAGIAKAVGTVQFSVKVAAIGWAIANVGYTYVTGASAWFIQTIAYAAVDTAAYVATSVAKVAGKVWSVLNKAQKFLTKKDLPGLSVSASAVAKAEGAAIKAKTSVDWFCEAGVRFMMDPIIRTTFFVFSTIAVAPIVINAWVGGALFAWAAQGVLISLFINPWFGALLFAAAMTGCLTGAIETRTLKTAVRVANSTLKTTVRVATDLTTDLKSRNDELEAELADALEAISIYKKIADTGIKRNGSGYMPKQKKAARV